MEHMSFGWYSNNPKHVLLVVERHDSIIKHQYIPPFFV